MGDFLSGRLADLEFQAKDELMMHEDAVTAVAFSPDSELLASGSQDGKLKVWQLQTGTCVRRFEPAHLSGVSSVRFSADGTQLLTASADQTAR